MEFTYTPNYGKIDYDEFTWLTGEYDPNNMYALDDRGKEYEKYVENLDQHGIWFIFTISFIADVSFVDNYGNIWTQETVVLKDRGITLKRCPYKQKEQRISTEKLPDQFIDWILKNKKNLSIHYIKTDFETFKQQITDVKDGINDFIKLLREKAKATETQIDEFRKNMAKLKNGTLKYELIPKLDTGDDTIPQSLLGIRYIIRFGYSGRLRHVQIDNTGQVWTLGELFATPFGKYPAWGGNKPRLRGERNKYPLPTIILPFVNNILNQILPEEAFYEAEECAAYGFNSWSYYYMSFLQPLAKYLFDNYAPENIKHDYLEAERLEQEEIKRKEDEKKRAEEEAKQKAIDEENRRIEEARRIKEEQDAVAEKKRLEEEIKAKEIAKAQAELREVQNRLNKLLSQ